MPTTPRDAATQASSVVGLVLAAGCSARMGRPKQLLPLGGRPLLQHAIDAALAARTLATVTVVLGHAAAEIAAALDLPATGIDVVVNPDHRDGQSTSLCAGLHAAPATATAAAVLLGDQPDVTAAQIDAIVTAFHTARTPIVRPESADGTPGHPVVLARAVWPLLDTLHGDDGARAVMASHPEWLTVVPRHGAPPVDIDTPEDYARACDRTPER